uniref:Matrixin family metalloprotease n=1 Tax=Eiseniibacteriota bacterium TaxID=2212470 RepID=A0A832IBH5_UNCEI
MRTLPSLRRAVLATALVAAFAAPPPAAAGTPAPAPVLKPVLAARLTDAAALPTLESLVARRPGALASTGVAQSDTFPVLSHAFQTPAGACAPRGWQGLDLTGVIFQQVQGALLTQRPLLGGVRGTLGPRALPAPHDAFALETPYALAVLPSGLVVFADALAAGGSNAFVWNPATDSVSAFPTPFVPSTPGSPAAPDPLTGGFFIHDSQGGDLYLYPPGGGAPTDLSPQPGGSLGDTTIDAADLRGASQIQTDAAGNVYMLFRLQNRVAVLRRSDLRVFTVAGVVNTAGFGGDGGPARAALLSSPSGIAVEADGSALYIADGGNARMRKVTNPLLETSTIETLGGMALNDEGQPYLLARSGAHLYYTAFEAVFRVPVAGGDAVRVAGTDELYTTGDGTAGAAQHLGSMSAIAPDGAGGVLVADMQRNLILRLAADGKVSLGVGAPRAVTMGARALRIGADMTTHPEIVRDWVQPEGYGNNWSQRLVTAPLAIAPDLAFECDVTLDLGSFTDGPSFAFDNQFFQIQVEGPFGWTPLILSIFDSRTGEWVAQEGLDARGTFKVRAALNENGNSGIVGGLASARFRIIVQTNQTTSPEDGFIISAGQPAPRAAALIDNIRVTAGAADVLPFEDFEDGVLDGWTSEAFNAANTPPGVRQFHSREGPVPHSQVELRSNFDFSNTSCVWQFTSPVGYLENGVYARITSPWVPLSAPDSSTLLVFSGKFANFCQARVVTVWALGKNAGDDRPRFAAPSFFAFINAEVNDPGLGTPVLVTDAQAPYVANRVVRYPQDFQLPQLSQPCDSIRFFFQVEDRYTQFAEDQGQLVGNRDSKLPYLDDVRILQLGVDRDYDGVADAFDACPDSSAALEDADGDGCVDATASMRHVEFWPAGEPIRFRLSQNALPGVTDGSDVAALEAAFQEWLSVNGADIPLLREPDTAQQVASPLDGVNLVTLEDVTFPFSPAVLAVTTTLEVLRPTAYDDRIVRPGQIVDKDILFNPGASFATATTPGSYDLQSVATHEIGHMLGLDHSGDDRATMYWVQLPGVEAASLSSDDEAAIASAYPAPALFTGWGAIAGRVTRDTTGAPVAGALVSAVRLDAGGQPLAPVVSDFTREDGSYVLRRLGAGTYALRVQTLDGSILDGLRPENVNNRLALVAGRPFEAEWWTPGDDARDDPTLLAPVAVSLGVTTTGIDVVTGLDTVGVAVVSVNPADLTTGVGIDISLQVDFSEPVEVGSLTAAFQLTPRGAANRLAGSGLLADGGRRFVFTPSEPLAFSTDYDLRITTALTDLNGVPIAAEFASSFRTQDQPPVAITDIQPRQVVPGATITVTGVGFDPAPGARNIVVFRNQTTGGVDSASAGFVTPSSLVATVPATQVPGIDSVVVVVNDLLNVSNTFAITVLPPAPIPAPVASGAPVSTGWLVSDVALSSDASMAYVAGDGGAATINLSAPAGGPVRSAVQRTSTPASAVGLTPDGRFAFFAHPADSAVSVMDADPASGTFGAEVARMRSVGRPFGLAVAVDGRTVWATDELSPVLHEFDLNPASPAFRSQRRRVDVPFGPLGRGLAADPRGDRLHIATTSGAHVYDLKDGVFGFTVPPGGAVTTGAAIAVTPDGGTVLQPLVPGRVGAPSGFVTTGGEARGLAVSPRGQAAYVANGPLNLLQVVGLDPNQPGYFTVAGVIGTGSGPTSVAVNAGGDFLAVGNRAGRSVSFYGLSLGETPPLVRISPDVAVAGSLVAAQGDASSAFDAGAEVDLGYARAPATAAASSGVGFEVPPTAARATLAAVETSTGERTLGLPFTIVEPVGAFAPRALFTLQLVDTSCAGSPNVVGWMRQLRVSPDGRTLAVLRFNQNCDSYVDLYAMDRDGARPFGALVGRHIVAGSSGSPVFDVSWVPATGRLWVGQAPIGVRDIDVNPASGTFGQTVAVLGPLGSSSGVLGDPLSRGGYIANTTGGGGGLHVLNPDGTQAALLDSVGGRIVATRDGRLLVSADDGVVRFVDLATRTQVARTGDYGVRFLWVEITPDGRRAAAIADDGRLAVWNLDPGAGAIGQQLYFGVVGLGPSTVDLTTAAAPGGDPSSLVAVRFRHPRLYRINLATVPPAVDSVAIGFEPSALAVTPDGRTLFVSSFSPDVFFNNLERVHVFTLSEGTALSMVSGPGQSAFPGQALPLPVRARVTGAGGRPEAGALVRFALDGVAQGSMDGGPALERTIPTDINGEAQVVWRMPGSGGAGPVYMTVSALGIANASTTVAATVAQNDADILPAVVALSPASGATGINAGSPVAVRFNQRMTPGVVDHITLTANGQPVAGTFSVQEQGRFIVFRPAAPLPFLASCELAVAPGATDLDGQTDAAGGRSAFTVEAQPVVTIMSLAPPAGPPGTAVVIDGAGFAPVTGDNGVVFNGVAAPVTAATITSLTANVPLAATSGPVTVTVAGQTSPGVSFIVLDPNATVGGVVGALPASGGIRDMAITPDGARAYVSNPSLNTVTALDLDAAQTITSVTVGLQPQSVAILAAPQRAYVANTGNNSVSVIDVDPASPDYHRVVKSIPVGPAPVDVVVSNVGPRVYVVNSGDGTISVVDGREDNATFDQVLTTINAGTGAQGVALSTDGTLAYVATAAGVVVIDLRTEAVLTTINIGTSAQSVAISTDGTLVFALGANGDLFVIDVSPGPNQNTVLTTINAGTGAQSVSLSTDGTLAYVTDGEGNQVLVFEIGKGSGANASARVPGPQVSLTLVDAFPAGEAPAGIAPDPLGRIRTYVVNSGSGTITVIGTPDALPLVEVAFDFNPNTLNVRSMGRWVTGYIEPPAPFAPEDVDVASLRLNGTVAVDPAAPVTVADHDADGVPDLAVKFPRLAVQLALPTGDRVETRLTGTIGTRNLVGVDSIRVRRGQVQSPAPNEVLAPGQPHVVRWTTPPSVNVEWVAVLHSFDHGATWTLDAEREPNDGEYAWPVPNRGADSVRVLVVLVESETVPEELRTPESKDDDVVAVLAVSPYFAIAGVTDVRPAPAELSFAVGRNPAREAAAMRFGLPRAAHVALEVFDLQGRRVRTLARGPREAGWHEATWRGEDESGARAGSGVFFVRFRAEGREFTRRLIWLR